ncbi:hypothetical protein [Agromyces aureus]|nr:hypothetical protein [Agromyces aureus]
MIEYPGFSDAPAQPITAAQRQVGAQPITAERPAMTNSSGPAPVAARTNPHVRIPTPPALVALFILCAIPGVIGAVLAVVGLVYDRDTVLLLLGAQLVLATLGLYFFLVLPLVAIIQAIHQTIRFRRS